jgi:hypothetical protein
VLPTAERSVVVARLTGLNHVDVIGAEDDVPDISDGPITPQAPVWGAGRPEQQLAMLAVRLEMTAVYLRLVRGQVECTCYAERYGPMHGFADRTCRVHRRTQSHSAPRKLSCGWARTLAIPPGR